MSNPELIISIKLESEVLTNSDLTEILLRQNQELLWIIEQTLYDNLRAYLEDGVITLILDNSSSPILEG